MEFVNICLL